MKSCGFKFRFWNIGSWNYVVICLPYFETIFAESSGNKYINVLLFELHYLTYILMILSQ